MTDLEILKLGRIKSAALRKDHMVYSAPDHSKCYQMQPKGELINAEQGFITETYTFVNRKEALEIAKYFNQINHKTLPEDELFSEDLL